jgi:hypothetical protein
VWDVVRYFVLCLLGKKFEHEHAHCESKGGDCPLRPMQLLRSADVFWKAMLLPMCDYTSAVPDKIATAMPACIVNLQMCNAGQLVRQ